MALQVWLPLNKDFKNNGLTNVKPQIIGNPSFNDDGICGKSDLSCSRKAYRSSSPDPICNRSPDRRIVSERLFSGMQ